MTNETANDIIDLAIRTIGRVVNETANDGLEEVGLRLIEFKKEYLIPSQERLNAHKEFQCSIIECVARLTLKTKKPK